MARELVVCIYNCVRLTKWIPVLFVLCVIGWSYYAYVVQLCFLNVEERFKRVAYLIIYHILLVLYVWSYLRAVFTKIKRPTPEFYLTDRDIYQIETDQNNEASAKLVMDKKARELPLLTRTNTGAVRFCDKCKCLKPDRAHHCSVCQSCVLKMDHHCPWVNNCVGHSNYKFFMLFLGYSVVYCLFIAATTTEYFIKFWTEIQSFKPGRFHLLFLFFVSIMFGISILTLFVYHLYLLAKNVTTLESFRPPIFVSTGLPDKNGFNLSACENFKQVFGANIFKAFLPVQTNLTSGVDFTQHVRLNLQITMLGDRNSKLNITHKWNHTSSMLNANMDHSSMQFPTLVKNYYRPQLQRNVSHVEDSFLISSFDATRVYQNPQFAKLNDSIDYNSVPDVGVVNERTPIKGSLSSTVNRTVGGKHSNFTFASLFKNNSTFTLNTHQQAVLFAASHPAQDIEKKSDEDADSMSTCESLINDQNQETRSTLDGIIYPTSTRQSLAQSHSMSATNLAGHSQREPISTTDSLLLRDKIYPENEDGIDVKISLD